MVYFVGTEKIIMISYKEIEFLEIENNILFIYFKSGNNTTLKVDIENLTEVRESRNFYLYNRNDIEIYNKIENMYNELEILENKYKKYTKDIYPTSYTDFEAMNEIERSRYEFLEESIKKLRYSFDK